jgi:hypothetical protein
MKQELITLPEHLSSPPVFSGVRVTRSLVLLIVVCPFVLFLLAIVLSVLLRYTDYNCPLQTLLRKKKMQTVCDSIQFNLKVDT